MGMDISGITPKPLKRTLKWVAVALAVYGIIGFLILPSIIKPILLSKLSEALHRKVSIQKIYVNPFALSATLSGLTIKDRDGNATFVSFDEMYVNLEAISIFKKGIVLKEVSLSNPYIKVVRNNDLAYNFSDLLESKKPKGGEPLRYSVNNIRITGGRVDFVDTPKNTTHKVTEMNVSLPFFSNLDYYTDIFVQPSFSAKFNGTPVSLKGESKPFSGSLETKFNIVLNNLDIPYYLSYSPIKMKFKVPTGYLDANTSISYVQYKNKKAPKLIVSGDVSLRKFKVTDTENRPVINIPGLSVAISSAELISKDIDVAKVVLDSPRLDVSRDAQGNINLLSLLPEKQEAKSDNAETNPLSLSVAYIRLQKGAVSFSDRYGGRIFDALLQPVDLTVVNFSNDKGWKTSVGLEFRTDAHEGVKFAGDFVNGPLMVGGTLDLSNIPVKRYAPYYRDAVLFDIEDGRLDMSTGLRYSAVKDAPETRVYGLSASLSNLRLRKRDESQDFVSIPELSLEDTSVDLVGKQMALGSLYTKGGSVAIKRFKDGNLDITQLVSQTGRKDKKGIGKSGAGRAVREKEWDFTLKRVTAESWTLKFVDLWPPKPASLTAEKIDFDGEELSTTKNSTGKISLSFMPNGKGNFSTTGLLGINPISVKVSLALKDVEASSMQAYFADKIKMTITDGKVAANGNLAFKYQQPKGMTLKYGGDVSLYDFASIDQQGADDFIKWKNIKLSGMNVSYGPNYVNIKEVTFTDFFSNIIVEPDGKLNVLGVFVQGAKADVGAAQPPQAAPPVQAVPAAPAQPAAKKLEWPVRVDKVTLQGGRVSVMDRHIKPSYSSTLTGINGMVTGLSSDEIKTADVKLSGKFNGSAPIDITGKVNPLKEDPFVDLNIKITGMDLSPVTPYSGRYLGYKIQKGKVSLDLKYLIDKKALDAKNKIFIDQFYLGDRVESPDATKLPVKLALALIRDRKGEIHLDMPVTGRTDDPKFKIGGIIIQIIWNVITKAATSPFSLLGALFGGGEELGYVEFDYGGYAIDEPSAKKLDNLGKALYDRPELKLSIEGHVDTVKDSDGLRQYLFDRQLKAQKLKEMLDEKKPAVPVDDVSISKDEYPIYLKLAYKAGKFKKPRNIIGIAKNLPPAEMEKLMLANIEVKDDDLRQLASRRAEKVKDYILASGQVGQERVFLVEPKALTPEEKEGLKNSRVVFILE